MPVGETNTNSSCSVVALFRAQASRSPDAVAIVCGTERLTYRELLQHAEHFAGVLYGVYGLRAGTVAGLSVRPSSERITLLLAVLMTGAAVLPLDPSYPLERRADMVQTAHPALVIADKDSRGSLETLGVPLFCTAAEVPEATARTFPDPGPEDICYILFTSGSTGGPKGVAMPHRGLANLIEWQIKHSLSPDAPTLQFAPLSFDVAFQEIFATLCGGGTLHLFPADRRQDPEAVADYLRDHAVERLFLPYVALQQLATAVVDSGRRLPALREAITAGEALVITPALRAFFASHPSCALWNHYGPTETHVATAYRLEGSPEDWPTLPPIGTPITGMCAHILDTHGAPAAPGVAGELYLGGSGVALGYWNRPNLTAERFVTVTDHPEWGLLYRTGDHARELPEGNLEFLGRFDDQVKVRGYRVEPGEVEQALLQHPGVAHAAVVAQVLPGASAETRLVAYVVPQSGDGGAVTGLSDFLAQRLPEWMLPARIVTQEALPLTASGKVDRRALPAPAPGRRAELPDGTRYVTPLGARETTIAAIWADLLGWDRVGAQDNFFEIGGHSLLAMVAQQRLSEAINAPAEVTLLFQYPTPRLLAAHLSVTSGDADTQISRISRFDAVTARASLARQAMGGMRWKG